MLVTLLADRNLNDGEFGHLGNVFETGNKFTNGDITRIEIRGVIGSAK